MPDPAVATIGFLSWVRQGLAANSGVASATTVKDGHLMLPITLRLNGTAISDLPVQLCGPGDVIGIDAREIIRIDPQNHSANFEPNYFACIEFNHPGFPWMFTPAAADMNGRLQPWLCLVVVRRDTSSLSADPTKPLPMLDCPQQELPDLSESWAWAHAQVVTGGSVTTIDGALNAQDRNISRLISARRLEEGTAYYACLVPTFEVGRNAGLGEAFTPDDERELRPAWTLRSGAGATRIKVPVYYHWEFSTGLAGDFEALARRLQPCPLPDDVGVQHVDVTTPGWGITPFPASAAGTVMQMEGALRAPGRKAKPWADDVRLPFQAALRQILATAASPGSPTGPAPVVGPPLYGQWYAGLHMFPVADTPPSWFIELNVDPRLRIAAGAGAQVVRFEQERWVAIAWDQIAAQPAADNNDRLKREQFGNEVTATLTVKGGIAFSEERFLQSIAPEHASMVASAVVPSSPIARKTTAAFRRLSRARGPIARRLAARGGITVVTARLPVLLGGAAAAGTAVPAAEEKTELLRFAPSFDDPMYEVLRDFFPDLLLPGLDRLPANSITLLETNPQFIEAFLVGANDEMTRELVWRDYPVDRRATCFRQFWDMRGRVPPPAPTDSNRHADIAPIAEWPEASRLGDHSSVSASASMMVLALRGDLLSRYPRAIVYAVEALWSSADADATRTLGTQELYPIFRVTRAPDITMLGFPVTAQQARGANRPTATGAAGTPSKDAGWFFVLQEQPTEPRFGLDVTAAAAFGTRPAQWSELSWSHLAPSAAALKQLTYVPIDGALKGLTIGSAAWGQNGAHMAFIVKQKRFRLGVHARTWLP